MRLSRTLFTAIILAAAVLPAATHADSGWTLRFGAVWVSPDGDFSTVNSDGETITSSADSDVGYSGSLEYRMSNRFGVEVGLVAGAENDFDVTISDPSGFSVDSSDALGFSSISAALNIYLTEGDGVEVYIGPVISSMNYDNLAFVVGGETARLKIDGDTAYGLNLGLDIPMGDSGWFVSGRLTYLVASFNAREADDASDPGVEVDFDPLMAAVGFGVRF